MLLLPFKHFTNSRPNFQFQISSQGPNFMANLWSHCLCNRGHCRRWAGRWWQRPGTLYGWRHAAPEPFLHILLSFSAGTRRSLPHTMGRVHEGPAHRLPAPRWLRGAAEAQPAPSCPSPSAVQPGPAPSRRFGAAGAHACPLLRMGEGWGSSVCVVCTNK